MTIRFQSLLFRSPHYRPDIDGLRAVAVLCVLFYHAGLTWFPGGFVGVDIFFVISGYLITSILVKDLDEDAFSFARFYERRIRRIFPALIAVSLVSAAVVVVLFAPHDVVNFGRSLEAVSGFVSNRYFADFTGALGYFASPTDNVPLLHTWSLSVEEQFYLVFPVLLLFVYKLGRRYRTAVLLVAALVSFGYSVRAVAMQPTAAFYVLPTRGWELLLGALLTSAAIPPMRLRIPRELVGIAGAGLVVYAVAAYDRSTSFPGLHALAPCLGAALLLYAGQHGTTLVRQVLSFKPLVFVGVISYSLYLWHWPIEVVWKYVLGSQSLGGVQQAVYVLLSLLMGFLSFEFIESPFRGTSSGSRQQVILFGVGGNVLLALAGYTLVALHGIPQRYSTATLALIDRNEVRRSDWISTGHCVSYMVPLQQYSDATFCEAGHAAKNVLFWGDSLNEQMYPAVQRLRAADGLHGEGAVFAFAPGCPPTEHMNRIVEGYFCDVFSQYAMQRAIEEDIDTVFLAFSVWWTDAEGVLCESIAGHCKVTLSGEQVRQRTIAELSAEIRTLQAKGKRVILSLPFPDYAEQVPDVMTHNAIFGRFGQTRVAHEISPPRFRAMEQQMAQQLGVVTFDPRETLCPGLCVYQTDGVSIYRDNTHLAASQSGVLASGLQKALDSSR